MVDYILSFYPIEDLFPKLLLIVLLAKLVFLLAKLALNGVIPSLYSVEYFYCRPTGDPFDPLVTFESSNASDLDNAFILVG